jgi:hypothetical protein
MNRSRRYIALTIFKFSISPVHLPLPSCHTFSFVILSKYTTPHQLLLKFPLLKECDLEAITLKEQFTRIVLASKSIVYAIGAVPYFVDYEGSGSSCSSLS